MGPAAPTATLAEHRRMSEAPKRRWFHYGEPWGLLAKNNPEATGWSVARRAAIFGVTYPWLYAAYIYFRQESMGDWPLKIAVCIVGFAALGALAEWQKNSVPD